MNRREAIAALAAAVALPLVPACARDQAPAPPATGETDALGLLDDMGSNLLRLVP